MNKYLPLSVLFIIISFMVGCGSPNQDSQTINDVYEVTPSKTTGITTIEPATETFSLPTSTLTVTVALTPPNLPEDTNTPIRTQPSPVYQLTFYKDSNDSNMRGIYAVNVLCQELTKACFSPSFLLLEWAERISSFDWSSDGGRIVFESQGILYMADWNGSNLEQISNEPGSALWPVWSPDGSKIAYIFGSETTPAQIRVYNLDTKLSQRILEHALFPSRVYWLPTNDIAYIGESETRDGHQEVYIFTPETETNSILFSPGNGTEFSYLYDVDLSQHDNKIVIAGERSSNEDGIIRNIYLLDRDHNNLVNLTPKSGNHFNPVWAPNDIWIAFDSDQYANYDIFIVDIGSKQSFQVTDEFGGEYAPRWRPLKQHSSP